MLATKILAGPQNVPVGRYQALSWRRVLRTILKSIKQDRAGPLTPLTARAAATFCKKAIKINEKHRFRGQFLKAAKMI